MLHTVAGHGCSGITGMFRLCYRRSSRCARKVPDPRRRVMRVLVLSRGVPCASSPLRGVFELDQAKALAAAGHDVLVGYVDGARLVEYGGSGGHIAPSTGSRRWGSTCRSGQSVPSWTIRPTDVPRACSIVVSSSSGEAQTSSMPTSAGMPPQWPELVSTTCPWCTPNTSPDCPSMVPTGAPRRTYAVPSGEPMPSLPCRAHSRTSWTPGTEPRAAWSPMSSTSTSSRRPSRTRMRRFRPCQTLGRDQVHELMPIWWQLGSSLNARG